MKTNYTTNAIVFLFLLISTTLVGQVEVTLDENLEAPADVDLEEVKKAIQEAIDEYQLYASLADEDEGGDLSSKVEKGFYNLFTDQGLSDVIQDFYSNIRPEDRGSPEDYVDIFRLVGLRGLDFLLIDPKITAIQENPSSGELNAVVHVDKKYAELYNREEGNTEYTGEIRKLSLNYVVFKEDGEMKAVIYSVLSREKIVAKEDAQSYLTIYGGVGSAVYSPEYNTYWDETHQLSALDIEGALSFSLGVEFMTNQFFVGKNDGRRRISPLAGVRASFHQFSATISDLQLDDFDAVASNSNGSSQYQRHARVDEGTEDITLMTIDVPLGVALRLNRTENMINRPNFFLSIRAIPSFGIVATSEMTATGNYDGTLYLANGALSEFTILNPSSVQGDTGPDSEWRAYNVGSNETIVGETDPAMSSLGLKFELSPAVFFNFNERSNGGEIMVGLDLGYQLLSNFAHDGINSVEEESFRFNNTYSESVINQYTDNLQGFTFGLRVGYYWRKQVAR